VSLLKKATVEQAAAKVGIFGRQGSGKTTTAALIAIGLSKTYHNSAPVAFYDTESGSDFVVELFATEGIELLHVKSRAFQDLREAEAEARATGCCCYLVDSYTHPWMELVSTFKEKSKRKRLEMHHMDELKTLWRGWTDQMLNSPVHTILAGRLGFEWGEEDDDEGNKKLVKLGTKLKSEADAGYEPHLLIEMEQLQGADVRMKKTRAKKGTSEHHLYVLKDRWRTLSGRSFSFKTMNVYKPGGYKPVFSELAPHWTRLVIGQTQRGVDGSRTSSDLFDADGQTNGQRRGTRATIACEEIQGILVQLWPGQDAASKKIKASVIFDLFDTHSWTAVEHKQVEGLETAVNLLRFFSEQVRAMPEPPIDPTSVVGLLQICRDKMAESAPVEEDPILTEDGKLVL
jgi:hypothetical protein